MSKRVCKTLIIALTALFCFNVAAKENVDWELLNPAITGASYVNDSGECVECHEDYMRVFANSRHGLALPDGGCESCHGPMSKHLEAPREEPPLLVSLEPEHGLTAEQSSSICLQCHEGGIQLNWHTSTHAAADNTCVTCHDPTGMDDPVLEKTTQTAVCFTCHTDKRALSLRRSRHPVREGKVVCSDCHNPHGSPAPSQLTENTVNETCYQCHAEKRGPFLWEHQPVREDCTLCHNPHGSTQTAMLNVRGPYLCQQCHSETRHPSTLYNGDGVPPLGAAQQLLGKNCGNCHSAIHGSNHPSGSRFTR